MKTILRQLRLLNRISFVMVILMGLVFHIFLVIFLWSIWSSLGTILWAAPLFVLLAIVPLIFIYFYLGTLISSFYKSKEILQLIPQEDPINNPPIKEKLALLVRLDTARIILTSIVFILVFTFVSVQIVVVELNQRRLENLYIESQNIDDNNEMVFDLK